MPATIIDGAATAQELLARLKGRVEALGQSGTKPGLAAVQLGDHPASKIYIRNKIRACEAAGVRSEVRVLPGDSAEADVVAVLEKLNRDAAVHGILLQLPLPPHLDGARLMETIAPEKDVDGLTRSSLGALVAGQAAFEPCTPAGVMMLLERAGVRLDGAEAVVIGRSTIVGKPMALLLMAKGATVTICHSRTRDLAQHARRADVLVAALGRPRFVTGDMVKPGAAVIDVGINRLADGKLAGDVDFAAASAVAGWITPVPGGVGPMTVAMLIANTVRAAERAASLGRVSR